jgi:hypothetical protein
VSPSSFADGWLEAVDIPPPPAPQAAGIVPAGQAQPANIVLAGFAGQPQVADTVFTGLADSASAGFAEQPQMADSPFAGFIGQSQMAGSDSITEPAI